MPDYVLSDHAKERFSERYPHLIYDQSMLDKSIQVGGQYGNEYALLNNEHGIIFIITIASDGSRIIKTILTEEMYYANISTNCKLYNLPIRTNAKLVEEYRDNSSQHLSQKARRKEYKRNILFKAYEQIMPIIESVAKRYMNEDITIEQITKVNSILTEKFKISEELIDLYWQNQAKKNKKVRKLLANKRQQS